MFLQLGSGVKRQTNLFVLNDKWKRKIPYKTEKRLDSNLPAGQIVQKQAGSKGLVVNTWKVIREGNGNETKQFLSRDSYAPANRILSVGS